MISYILTLIVSFFGIISGTVLALIAPEELKKGEKYWKILSWIIFIIILASVFYFSKANILWPALICVVLVILKIFKKEYPALAFVLLFSYFENFLFLAGSLIFIYGLPEGTLNAKQMVNMKNAGKKITEAILHSVKKNILYLIFGFILLPLLIAYA
jgi:hypothetical protein